MKRKIPISLAETGNFQELLKLNPRQFEYNTILRNLSIGRMLEFPQFYPYNHDFSGVLIKNFKKCPKYDVSII